jgi:hypothetical protein
MSYDPVVLARDSLGHGLETLGQNEPDLRRPAKKIRYLK